MNCGSTTIDSPTAGGRGLSAWSSSIVETGVETGLLVVGMVSASAKTGFLRDSSSLPCFLFFAHTPEYPAQHHHGDGCKLDTGQCP